MSLATRTNFRRVGCSLPSHSFQNCGTPILAHLLLFIMRHIYRIRTHSEVELRGKQKKSNLAYHLTPDFRSHNTKEKLRALCG